MSKFVPLPSDDTSTSSNAPPLVNGTLAVMYRVQDGIVQGQSLDGHFTPANGSSTVKICAKSSRFEQLGETLTLAKPNPKMGRLVKAFSISAAALTLIVLIASSIPTRFESSEAALIWASVNIPFCIYQIVAGFIGRVHYIISFALTILLLGASVLEVVMSSILLDYVGAPLIFVIAAIYIAHAVVLGRVINISSMCRCSGYEEDESMIGHFGPVSNYISLPVYSPTDNDVHHLTNGMLTVLYHVQDGIVQGQGLDSHLTPANDYATVKICAQSSRFEKLGETLTLANPTPKMVLVAKALPISAAVLTLIVLIVSSTRYDKFVVRLPLFWAVANIPLCVYQIVAGFVGRVNYIISFVLSIILVLGAFVQGVLSSVLREWVSVPLVLAIFAIYIAHAVILSRIADISRICRRSDGEEDTTNFSGPLEEKHLLGNYNAV